MVIEIVRLDFLQGHGPVIVAYEERPSPEAREPFHNILRIGNAAAEEEELRLRRGEGEG